ncbi:MAG: signal peptidase I [Minisyncoccia bacterium]
MMRTINFIFYTVFVSLLLGIAGLLIGSMLPIPGNIELKIVKSGSMEPTIPTGSLVIVKPSTRYSIGDVITFGADTATEIPTTHRIIAFTGENGETRYTTKGDANEDADPNPVARQDVIGKIVLHIPYVGFILDFARQPLGFALLIGVPAALVILEEVITITREVKLALRRRRSEKDDDEGNRGGGTASHHETRLVYLRRRAMDEIFVPMAVAPIIMRQVLSRHEPHADAYGTATALVMGLVFVSTLMSGGAGGTIAYFSDIERSIGNIFRAGSGPDFLGPVIPVIVEEDVIVEPLQRTAAAFEESNTDGEVLGATTDEPAEEGAPQEPETNFGGSNPPVEEPAPQESSGSEEVTEPPEITEPTPEPSPEPEPTPEPEPMPEPAPAEDLAV